MKEKLKKKQEDEINKTNILINKKKNMPKKMKTENNVNKKNKSVEQRIQKIYDWEQNRKKKLEENRKMQNEKIETQYDYKPKINHHSTYLVQFNKSRKKEPNTFKRLAKEDPVVTAKFEVLTEMYTPSFKPFLHRNTLYEGSTEARYLEGVSNKYSMDETLREEIEKEMEREEREENEEPEEPEENEEGEESEEEEEKEKEEGEKGKVEVEEEKKSEIIISSKKNNNNASYNYKTISVNNNNNKKEILANSKIHKDTSSYLSQMESCWRFK